ncbi:MAG: hypothetical protein GY819_09150 [Planctomycetaceae bacterium]|nr:hypothetical protein [Planctomycetaceae bacterium]
MHRLLPALAFLSGVSGIAYEVLYVRLISTYLGNVFYVSAALLAIFFAGIAAGSFLANRFIPYLKYIEIAIGAYAIVLALIFKTLGLEITRWVASLPGPDLLVLPLFVFVLLAQPATLIGFSLPLFASFIGQYKKSTTTFTSTYAIYNIGAALSVVAIEYLLIWNLGIATSLIFVATINLAIGALVYGIDPPNLNPQVFSFNLVKHLDPALKQAMIALFVVSIGSGIMQLNLFSLSYHIIGPHNENFALLVATSLLGVAAAGLLLWLARLKFVYSLMLISLFSLLPFVFLLQIQTAYVNTYLELNETLAGVIVARSVFFMLLALPIFFAFSTSIPALVREWGGNYAGLALAVSALGNVLGYLLFLFYIFDHFFHLAVAIGCGALTWLSLLFYLGKRGHLRATAVGVIVLGLGIASIIHWPLNFYGSSYADRVNLAREDLRSIPREVETFKQFGSETTLVTLADDTIELHFNGYRSLSFNRDELTILRETLVGSIPAFFSGYHENALVFGMGTGITASATADSYRQLTVAEINLSMLEATARFREENNDILNKFNVTIRLQDGLIALLESDVSYDAIINTVPTPRFFSANKLWTTDLFAAARQKLKPNGVFVGWLDARLGKAGIDILEQTLRQSFARCVFMLLGSGYHAFICSKDKLRFVSDGQPIESKALTNLLATKNWHGDQREFVLNLLFRSSRRVPDGTGVNSLDRPLLEFVHQPEGQYANALETSTRLFEFDPIRGGRKSEFLCRALQMVDAHNDHQMKQFCAPVGLGNQ